MRRPTRTLAPAALAALVLLSPATSHAQGVLTARVTASVTGEPLRGAEVRIPASRRVLSTGDSGTVDIPGLLVGRHVVEVRMLGYATRRVEARVESSSPTTVAVTLDVDPVEMAALTAEAEKRTWGTRMLESRGFYDRQRLGTGRFITRDQIATQKTPSMPDLLRRFLNMRFSDSQNGSIQSTSRTPLRGTGRCSPLYYVDGIFQFNLDLQTINPESVEGIEVYRGSSETPNAYRQRDARCGAILIWTRVR
ncbi:MAG TPA: TonB-dependent receptor plug domain-containing protein [Longimicrobiaceae bacterium]|jgi:hypothetical protein|nr:TonB-dependent receptor plug domain-containing protein [Longimicrobiaceae bacterium]